MVTCKNRHHVICGLTHERENILARLWW